MLGCSYFLKIFVNFFFADGLALLNHFNRFNDGHILIINRLDFIDEDKLNFLIGDNDVVDAVTDSSDFNIGRVILVDVKVVPD